MIPVRSSAILRIEYNPPSQRMKIRFKQGDTCDLSRVPASVFEAFLATLPKEIHYDQ